MSQKIFYLILAVSLGLNIGLVATTMIHRTNLPPQGPPSGPGGGPGGDPGSPPDPQTMVEQHVRGITRHLDLDPQQQQAIRVIMEQRAPQLIEYQMAAAEAARRLVEVFASPDFDPQEFQRLTAQTSLARASLDSLSAVMLVEETAVLTVDQRQKYAKVAPTIHSNPQRPQAEGGPPGRDGPPPEGDRPPPPGR